MYICKHVVMYILLVLLLPDGDGCARSHREISTWPAVGTGSQQLSPAKICNRDRRLYLASPLRRQPSLLLFSDTARCCLDSCSYRRVSLSLALSPKVRDIPHALNVLDVLTVRSPSSFQLAPAVVYTPASPICRSAAPHTSTHASTWRRNPSHTAALMPVFASSASSWIDADAPVSLYAATWHPSRIFAARLALSARRRLFTRCL